MTADRRLDRAVVAGELDEIDASVRSGAATPTTTGGASEFPLTTIAADFARLKEEIATGRGFFVFRGLDRDRYSDNDLGLIFRGLWRPFRPRPNAKCVWRPARRYSRHQR